MNDEIKDTLDEFDFEVGEVESVFENNIGLGELFEDKTPQNGEVENMFGGEINTPKDDPEVFEEDEGNVDLPHIKVDVKKFMDALKMSNVIAQKGSKDIYGKTIALEVVKGKLKVYLTDSVNYIIKEIDLLNSDNVLEDFVVVNYSIISKIMLGCRSTLTIYKKDGKYIVKMIGGGDAPLETYVNLDRALFTGKSHKFVEEGEVETSVFTKILKNFFNIASDAVSANHRKVYFRGNSAVSFCSYAVARYKDENCNFSNFDLCIPDIKILYILSSSCEDSVLKILKAKDRYMIKGGDFSYSFIPSTLEPKQEMIEGIDKVVCGEGVIIDSNALQRFADMASSLINSLYRIEFNFTENKTVSIKIPTKKDDITTILTCKKNENILPLEKAVNIQSNLIKTVMKIYSQEANITMFLNPIALALKNGNFESIVYVEGGF
jgi:hypothetical protein